MIEENKSENTVMALKMQKPRRKLQSISPLAIYLVKHDQPFYNN